MKLEQLKSEELVERILDSLGDGVFFTDNEARIFYCNKTFADSLGLPPENIVGRVFFDFLHPGDRARGRERFDRRVEGHDFNDISRYRFVHQINGSTFWAETRVTHLEMPDIGQAFLCVSRDISEREAVMEELRLSGMELRQIIENMPDVFYRTDMNGIVTMVSGKVFDLVGYQPHELIGKPMSDFYVDASQRQALLEEVIKGGGKASAVEAVLRHKSGARIWASSNVRLRHDANGNPIGVEGISRDVTERKERELKLQTLANTDPLTGLLNRSGIEAQMMLALDNARRHDGRVAVLFIDMDDMKSINDGHGHDQGDAALVEFARRLKAHTRDDDIVGRMGGDEFLIAFPANMPLEAVATKAETITNALSAPFAKDISISASIGIALFPDNGTELEQLIQHADRAMYDAKRAGKSRVSFVAIAGGKP